MKRPNLNTIDMEGIFDGPNVIITMSAGQWDGFLQAGYDSGHILLELDERETPVRAYRKRDYVNEKQDETLGLNTELFFRAIMGNDYLC